MFVTRKRFNKTVSDLLESMDYERRRAIDEAEARIKFEYLSEIYGKLNRLNERIKQLEERK
ncbi:hypothetical protein K0H71_15220 [Bacillus sp. IITD106]|nr:hypothetical protein [Bacillus sp. IITD106]